MRGNRRETGCERRSRINTDQRSAARLPASAITYTRGGEGRGHRQPLAKSSDHRGQDQNLIHLPPWLKIPACPGDLSFLINSVQWRIINVRVIYARSSNRHHFLILLAQCQPSLSPCVSPISRWPLIINYIYILHHWWKRLIKGVHFKSNIPDEKGRVPWTFSGCDHETLTLIIPFWFTLGMICYQHFRLHPVSVRFGRPLMIGLKKPARWGAADLTAQLRTIKVIKNVFHITELIEHPVQDQPSLVLISRFQISCMFFGGGVLESLSGHSQSHCRFNQTYSIHYQCQGQRRCNLLAGYRSEGTGPGHRSGFDWVLCAGLWRQGAKKLTLC